ncbi:MAG: DHH family phosphoesterase, partial [Lactimicrobium massiliense]
MNCRLVEVDGSAYASAYGLGPLAAKLCAHSQLDDAQMKDLLGDDALTTSKAECVKAACDRLLKAKDQNEKVFVGGDYDADGICATTIMKKTLDLLGITNGYYIPDRLKEGYGLSAHTVQLAKQKGYSLIITVDNGVKAHEAIQAAHDLGMEIIITDHHTIDEEVGADILVHPTLMEEQYKTLSGAGVALEISRNLIGNDEMLNSIACVAAIGDVMPLWHETRRIVKRGIHNLSQGIPASVCALFNGRGRVDETAIAFQIVPKLNAVGRMNDDSNVNTVVPFLLSENRAVIADYARQLNDVNRARQNISARMLTKAK